jgi:GT2 family glycosyltransferase
MSREYRIGVVIVNYKTADLTLGCVESLRGQLDMESDHIIIIDNGSGKAEIRVMEDALDRMEMARFATVIALKNNRGFSSGNNRGIREICAKYYLLANSDTIFLHGAVTGLLDAAARNPGAGIFSPRLESPDGEAQVSCFRYKTPLSEMIRAADTGAITSLLRRFNVPILPIDCPAYPEWTSFACVLIRAETFERVGLLDENYFMYYEDMDYCLRARSSGIDIVNWPYSHVVHLQGRSSDIEASSLSGKKLPDFYYHSRSWYYLKHYGKMGLLFANICWLAGRSVSLMRQISNNKERPVPQAEYLGIWKMKRASTPKHSGAKS